MYTRSEASEAEPIHAVDGLDGASVGGVAAHRECSITW